MLARFGGQQLPARKSLPAAELFAAVGLAFFAGRADADVAPARCFVAYSIVAVTVLAKFLCIDHSVVDQ